MGIQLGLTQSAQEMLGLINADAYVRLLLEQGPDLRHTIWFRSVRVPHTQEYLLDIDEFVYSLSGMEPYRIAAIISSLENLQPCARNTFGIPYVDMIIGAKANYHRLHIVRVIEEAIDVVKLIRLSIFSSSGDVTNGSTVANLNAVDVPMTSVEPYLVVSKANKALVEAKLCVPTSAQLVM